MVEKGRFGKERYIKNITDDAWGKWQKKQQKKVMSEKNLGLQHKEGERDGCRHSLAG